MMATNTAAKPIRPNAPTAGTRTGNGVTSVTESLDDVGSEGLAAETLAVFEMSPDEFGGVTVMVSSVDAPLASEAMSHVTVPPDSPHPADADTNG